MTASQPADQPDRQGRDEAYQPNAAGRNFCRDDAPNQIDYQEFIFAVRNSKGLSI